MESPAQLADFRQCIEKCQALRQQGQLTQTSRSKTDLLTIYQDELKTPNSQHKFKRASTIIEHPRHPKQHKRKLSYQHSLPSIGEEGANESSRDGGKGRKRSEARPTFLNFAGPGSDESRSKRAVVVMKEDLKKRPPRASLGEVSTKGSLSSYDGTTPLKRASHSSSSIPTKRSAMRKYVASQDRTPLSPISSPPAETSPRRTRKPKKPQKLAEKPARNPPLSQLRDDSKFTSSEFQADVEDFDAISPSSVGEGEHQTDTSRVIVNTGAAANSTASNTITIEAEVHLEGERPKLETSETSAASLILPPPPPSSRPTSRSASPISSPSLTVRPLQAPSPSPPLKRHSPHASPLPHVTSLRYGQSPQEDSYSHDCSSDFLIPRERTNSSPPPPSHNSPHDSSPIDTETDTDTLLPPPASTSSSGTLPLARALSPSSPTSSKRKLSFVKQGSGSSRGGFVFLNTPGVGEDSDC